MAKFISRLKIAGIILLACIGLGLAAFASYWYSPGTYRHAIYSLFIDISSPEKSLGGDRPALVHLPNQYDSERSWPLVLSLHGYKSFPAESETYLHAIKLRNELGYIIVSPEGSIDHRKNHYWDATEDCCAEWGEPVDDVSYLTGLVAEARTRYNIDPEKIFVLGFSNGGYMAYRLACEDEGLFRGLIVIAGLSYVNPSDCKRPLARHIVHFHGTADKIIPMESRNPKLSASTEVLLQRWAAINECGDSPELLKDRWQILRNPSQYAELWQWPNCKQGSVHFVKLQGSGHIPWFRENPLRLAWPLISGSDESLGSHPQ